MQGQITFYGMEENRKNRKTRKEIFLEEMEKMIPWEKWLSIITKANPESKVGRPRQELEIMLRMYLVQTWFSLSDEATEEAVYDSFAIRKFVGCTDLMISDVPVSTTLLRFRHMLSDNSIGEKLFTEMNAVLEKNGILLKKGTIVDATIIEAPSSTKNKEKTRDPEMHSTKKANQYHFGCKLHIGVDKDSGLVHSSVVTAANVHDVTQTGNLLHGSEKEVYGDSGYLGGKEYVEDKELAEKIEWEINMRPSSIRKIGGNEQLIQECLESLKSSVRAKVEHIFGIIKGVFKFRKTRYRGLKQNKQKLDMLLVLANIYKLSRAKIAVPKL